MKSGFTSHILCSEQLIHVSYNIFCTLMKAPLLQFPPLSHSFRGEPRPKDGADIHLSPRLASPESEKWQDWETVV